MILRLLLSSVLSLLLLCPALTASAQDEIIVKTYPEQNDTPTEAGRLVSKGNNLYSGSITLSRHFLLEYKGAFYRVAQWTNYWDKSPVGDSFVFSKENGNWNHIFIPDTPTKYKLEATLSSDNSSITLKFLVPDPPKPVSATINGKKIVLLGDAIDVNKVVEYPIVLNSTKTPVTISDITFDGKTYRLKSQPTFASAKEEGSQTISLVEGSGTTTLNVKGYYKLSLRVDNGTPTAVIIQKYSEDNRPDTNAYLSPTFPESMIYCENFGAYIPDEPLTLWYNNETYKQNIEVGNFGAQYNEVFLLGNGRLGIATECNQTEGILVNEKTNYDSKPDPSHKTVDTGTYCPIGFFKITRNGEEAKGSFLRQLDLTTAVASAINRWTSNGKEKIYTREYFVSQPDDVAVLHLTTNGEVKLNYSFSSDLSGTASADGFYSVNGHNTSNCDIHYNLSFKVVQKGGQLSSSGGSVTVKDADEITVVFAVGTNYDIDSSTFYSGESDSQIAARVKSTVERAASLGWQQLYDNHIAEYSPQFNAARFELTDALNNAPIKDLKANYDGSYGSSEAYSDEQTMMVDMLLFAMGRYLNLASSRGDLALPSNLQGIWANSGPQWNCDYHANINLQMNYWAAENTNIPGAHMPFLGYLKKMAAKQWGGYAEKLAPGCGGWVHHFATNTFGASGQLGGNYSAGATWNCTHIWQHYLYTQDRRFLADYFDTLYGLAKFLFAYMKDVDGDDLLEVPEYFSPESDSGSTVAVHSQQLAYQHLCNTRDAAIILGKTDEAEKCQQYLDKMYTGIDIKDGYQCEWKGALTSKPTHRHLSHLMSLYPLAQVSPYDSDLTAFNGSYNSLLQRGDADEGEDAAWNTAWKMACYARSLKGDLALRQLAVGMAERITPDLRTTCKHTFQIEGGAGIAAAIGEMLLQSYSGVIDILPALPSNWNSGSFKGMKAVGNYEVSASWEDGILTSLNVTDCPNPAVRKGGVKLRIHAAQLPEGDIHKFGISGVAASVSRSASRAGGRLTFTYEPETDTYLVHIPEGSPKTLTATFDGSETTGIETIGTDDADSVNSDLPVELFDLQGRRVPADTAIPGIYIRRQGSQVTKILVGAN